ncbi:hypothetical protein GCM10010306_034840 [Streptomyces umbrinus]|uniref:hypothetical protein n=1 Tax=Streptomyces umbrinus TaxID=67370 RepID=UPI001675354D|nr:hypothetical protein [Streptomyces umbrinus]GHB38050.1 hypothetical protein GCM10010306_034840 [Streptomyces umbrinus]
MTSAPQRRARLRRARHRPAPNHVRARFREEPPGPEPAPGPEVSRARRVWQRIRRDNWAHIITVTGTALAAVAAIGGLWAQAVASYWSQQTARDQLAQSKEESALQRRDQASKVTYWVQNPWGRRENVKIHVLNRSPDPVSGVRLMLHVNDRPAFMQLSNVPPCADIVYSAPSLLLGTADTPREERPKLSDPDYRWAAEFMYFIDSNGNDWTRTSTGLDERAPLPKATMENPIGQGIGNIAVFEEQVGEAGLCEGRGK